MEWQGAPQRAQQALAKTLGVGVGQEVLSLPALFGIVVVGGLALVGAAFLLSSAKSEGEEHSNPGNGVSANRAELVAKLERGEQLMCSFNGNTVEATPWPYAEGKYSTVVKRGIPGVEDRTFTNDSAVAVDNFIRLCRL